MFVFGALRYEQDHFSGFDCQGSATAGLGYRLIDTEKTKLSGTLGAGFRRLRPEQLVKDAAGNVIQRIKGEKARPLRISSTTSSSGLVQLGTRAGFAFRGLGQSNQAYCHAMPSVVKSPPMRVVAPSLQLSFSAWRAPTGSDSVRPYRELDCSSSFPAPSSVVCPPR